MALRHAEEGARLKALREGAGVGQRALERQLDLGSGTLRHIERGDTRAPTWIVDAYERIAAGEAPPLRPARRPYRAPATRLEAAGSVVVEHESIAIDVPTDPSASPTLVQSLTARATARGVRRLFLCRVPVTEADDWSFQILEGGAEVRLGRRVSGYYDVRLCLERDMERGERHVVTLYGEMPPRRSSHMIYRTQDHDVRRLAYRVWLPILVETDLGCWATYDPIEPEKRLGLTANGLARHAVPKLEPGNGYGVRWFRDE